MKVEAKKAKPTVKKRNIVKQNGLIDRIGFWMDDNNKLILRLILGLSIIFSFLLFNVRVSEGGDDSTYIKAGYDYSANFFNYYYSFNAPFYPMFLSLPIKLFGLNLILLKLLSVAFNCLSILFFYKAFYKRIQSVVLFPVLVFISANSFLQYFASQTYNESFYLFWQSLFFYSFFNLIDKLQEPEYSFKKYWMNWLLIGILSFIITLTKNVAIMLVPAVIVFFIIRKEWKNSLVFLGSFLFIKIPFELIKNIVWGPVAQLKSQGEILLAKDPYNVAKGQDDFSGFVGRFFDNCGLYLSKRFFQIIGFRSETSTETFGVLTILVIILIVSGLIISYKKKNSYLLLAGLFSGAIAFATFVVLQARWDQPRMVLIHMPVILLLCFYTLYTWSRKLDGFKAVFLISVLVISVSTLISSVRKSAANVPILQKNFQGDIYAGYSEDWKNFLKMSKWCKDSLPDDALVASRKAPMSFMYANGKEFYPVYKVIAMDTITKVSNPDSVLTTFKRDKVTHVLIASLRLNPNKNTGQVINTMHKILEPVLKKYPEKVKIVHQIGISEPSYLYEIRP